MRNARLCWFMYALSALTFVAVILVGLHDEMTRQNARIRSIQLIAPGMHILVLAATVLVECRGRRTTRFERLITWLIVAFWASIILPAGVSKYRKLEISREPQIAETP